MTILDTKEQKLLKEEAGVDIAPLLSLRSQTKVDTGGWLGSKPVWVCVTSDELFLVAAGRRPFFERVSLQDCAGSHYNAATGEVVLSPTEALMCNQLALLPTEAMELLKAMGIEASQWTAKVAPAIPDEDDPVAAILRKLATSEPAARKDASPKPSKFAKFKAQNQ